MNFAQAALQAFPLLNSDTIKCILRTGKEWQRAVAINFGAELTCFKASVLQGVLKLFGIAQASQDSKCWYCASITLTLTPPGAGDVRHVQADQSVYAGTLGFLILQDQQLENLLSQRIPLGCCTHRSLWGKRPGIDRFGAHKYNPMWSQGNLLEKPFSELLAFIVQQAEPEGQSLDLQKSTPFKLEWSPPAIYVIS